jgi:hypothetical protein
LLKVTIFAPTVIGYVAWPDALFVRGLAGALADRGHDVRVVEERRNRYFSETLRVAGSTPSREFFDSFPLVQHHTYEPRSGARLLEWVTREIALLDVAVAVAGIDEELQHLLGSLVHPGLSRVFVAFGDVPSDQAAHLAAYDGLLSPRATHDTARWFPLPATVATSDQARLDGPSAAHDDVAEAFERAIAALRDARSATPQSEDAPYRGA